MWPRTAARIPWKEKKMSEFAVALLAFLFMIGAALLGLFNKTKPPSEMARLFITMTGLVLGLMLNTAKNTLETNNRNIRTLATELILADRTMRGLGPEGQDARRYLVEYLQAALKGANILEEDPQEEALLEAARTSLRAIRVSDEQKVTLWHDARELLRQVVRQRWVLVDASGGTIPMPLIMLLILWLAFIFASFGYRARRNATLAGTFLVAALLLSAALYLILEMDKPFSGTFQVSNVPFQRALARLQQ
jgi:hypothetical protein